MQYRYQVIVVEFPLQEGPSPTALTRVMMRRTLLSEKMVEVLGRVTVGGGRGQ